MRGAHIHAFQVQSPLPAGGEGKQEGGLRTRESFKRSHDGKQLVTVVTVVFNGEQQLEATIQSVLSQTYANVEYIIIDGGSNDGTLEIIKKYENEIDFWVSEQDEGIYDAMNKGINLARGNWINFMNAGDLFFDKNVMGSIFTEQEKIDGFDMIYGDALVAYPEYDYMRKVRKAGCLKDLWKGMQFSHQSVFVSTSHIKQNKFNLANKLAADFELIYFSYCQHKRFFYTGKVISSISAGGASDKKRVQVYRERLNIVSGLNNKALVYSYYSMKIIDSWARSFLKHVLPPGLIKRVIRIKQ